jgi:hypothetical protein
VDAVRLHHEPMTIHADPARLLQRVVQFACLVTDCVATGREDLCIRLRQAADDHLFMKPLELSGFLADCLAGYRAMAADWGYGALAGREGPIFSARPV